MVVKSKRRTRKLQSKTLKNKSNNPDFYVAIPTYKRYKQVFEKSIKTLIDGGIDYKKIHIFVANKDEYEKYKSELPENVYGKIIIGVLGITNQRNFIVNYFKKGDAVLFLDDDVERIEKLKKDGSGFIEMKRKTRELNTFICSAFKECRENNIYLWGIYPVRNAFFMKPRPEKTYDLRFILGTFYGMIIRHDYDLKLTLREKEDLENTILHYIKDGSVLRFEKVTLKTKFFNPDGGIGALENRKKVHKKSALYLEKKYTDYGRIKVRDNGIYEFVLKPNPHR
jgi:hypothetical protein